MGPLMTDLTAAQIRYAQNKAIEDESKQFILTRCRQLGLPEPVEEHRFTPERRWRFDLAWPDDMLALEFEGGIYSGGRHTRGIGYAADLAKYNEAALLGWRVLRVTHRDVLNDIATALLERAFIASISAPQPSCNQSVARENRETTD